MKNKICIALFLAGLAALASRAAPAEADSGVSPAENERMMKMIRGDLSVTTNELERFYALDNAARNAYAAGKKDDARMLALELESLAPKYKTDWNFGNAVQDSNQVLGLLALDDGDAAEAKKRLLASAGSKGSPQMNSFGPNFDLAKKLLRKGGTETVIEYFGLCRKFWKMDRGQLDEWTATIKGGGIPKGF